ncbi:MAG: dienelactone hydrolase family protein, partial [Myxococcales bacterium]|nr:dienelactone hydrolase family protein [Myxococcales bacterium]
MALPGFQCSRFRHDGEERDVYRRDPSNGPGPAVVVIHEVPGITPAVRRFGERLVEEGYSVFLPHLFGTPDEPEDPFNTGRALLRACILHEFRVLARRGASPIT